VTLLTTFAKIAYSRLKALATLVLERYWLVAEKDSIMSGKQKKPRNITIIDVAREANVSYSTVSRVLNNYPHIKPDKRERVLEAAQRLGYVANPMARTLAGGQARVIGLLVPDLMTEYTAQILLGVDEALAIAGYDLMLHTTHHQRVRESQYTATLAQGMTEGLLLLLPLDPDAYLQSLREKQFPYVVIDRQGFDDFSPTVTANNVRGAKEAVQYLLELGHTRIGFIAGTASTSSSRDREDGYRAALAEAGIPTDDALIVGGNFDQPGGFRAAQALLNLPDPPTAIFAANDASALGAFEAIRSRGLQIPRDVSVVGFDDIPRAGYSYPPLTTVRQPLTDIGRLAARLLLKRISNPDQPPERIVLETELVIRESCQPPQPVAG
jgi:LacI family transcriptional regulator